ncbi:hypothetical protein ACF073_37810 [Streptomyces sp. NPDC015171]|uniref:hypothetical protein n=1 Tax=Streptomyces sp. NPDC015171 TaxID=3364945 RepID=UPI0036F5E6A4
MATPVTVKGWSAHDAQAYGPYFCGSINTAQCGRGGVTDGHTWVWACDDQSDGKGYAVYYTLKNGKTGHVADSNGHSSSCGNVQVTISSNPVTIIQGVDTTDDVATDPVGA